MQIYSRARLDRYRKTAPVEFPRVFGWKSGTDANLGCARAAMAIGYYPIWREHTPSGKSGSKCLHILMRSPLLRPPGFDSNINAYLLLYELRYQFIVYPQRGLWCTCLYVGTIHTPLLGPSSQGPKARNPRPGPPDQGSQARAPRTRTSGPQARAPRPDPPG